MRRLVAAHLERSLLVLGALACQAKSDAPAPASNGAPVALSEEPAVRGTPRPRAVIAVEKSLQATRLRPPPRRGHEPRLAFGKGVFARLSEVGVEVYEDEAFRLLESLPLEAPRALLTLADGALLAVGGRGLMRWEPTKRKGTWLPKPVLLPDAELYADAREPDRFWVFEPRATPPTLCSFRLPTGAPGVALLLPEQTIGLAAPGGGVVGTTREGVWLYLTRGRAERFGPGGGKLAPLALGTAPLPLWLLPSRRLDQSFWVHEQGTVTRALVSPSYRQLSRAELSGTPYAAEVGDEGRLLAVVVVTGEGPRFELELFDSKPERVARIPLPSEAPTGNEDWVRVVTKNQEVAVAGGRPRVAVGGPDRFRIFDGAGNVIFSNPSL